MDTKEAGRVIQIRIDTITRWLKNHSPGVFRVKKHEDKATVEYSYFQLGYKEACQDMLLYIAEASTSKAPVKFPPPKKYKN